MMVGSLEGQVAIVTGADGGLGTPVTKALLAAGATVVGIARSISVGPAHDGHFYPVSANLIDREEVASLVARLAEQFGKIDILVHVMGGFAGGASVAETDDATWQKMIDINLNAAFYVLRAVIPVMRRGEHGRIIAIGSRQAVQPAPGVAAYAASKAALVSLVQTAALENKDKNILANVILPGTMDTPANRAAMPKADFAKWVKTSHVAELVLLLAGEAGDAITGAAIPEYGIDG
ncbi:MAG TPA: SDR family NAD(P)-dependent oxidoreductase [Candidatus Binatia bacterium]|jgi:NAD(P)-dependent dehydrogenase (short-subunit alcohol dehydrogenase family)|nr:SDR family NAD(P)-dependent oxidoreductase [Candidatus Binatia bacterium]